MKKTAWMAATTCAMAIALSDPAFAAADEAAAVESTDAELATDIIVNARRISERLQDVPVAVSVLNSEDIANQNIVNAFDLAMRLPSLNATNILGSTSTTFSLRGFVQDIGAQPTVGVYFGDVVAPRGMTPSQLFGDGAGAGSFFDLQNVQVLKGPQGTLFGRNTTGGAVLLVPKAPTDRLEGYVEAGLGNYDMRRIQGVINIPFSDTAAIRLGVDAQDREGYLRNTTGVGPKRFNDVGYIASRASLLLKPSDTIENLTIFTYTKTDQVGDAQSVFFANAANQPAGRLVAGQIARARAVDDGFYTVQSGNPQANTRQDVWQIINSTTWDASDDIQIKNIISYASLKNKLDGAIFGTYVDLSDINGFLTSLGRPALPVGTFAQLSGGIVPFPNYSVNQRTFTEELRVQGKAMDGRLDYQAGVYTEIVTPKGGQAGTTSFGFLRCGNDIAALICANPSGLGNAGQVTGATNFRSFGLYAQSSYKLTDDLTLTGGFRYTWDKTRGVGVSRRFNFPIGQTPVASTSITCTLPGTVAPDCVTRTEQKSSAPTWVVSLDYKVTPDTLVYAKYSRGYRAGGVQLQDAAPLNTFDQEKLETYEAGVKYGSRGAVPVSFNLAAFYNDFSNQQIQITLLPTIASLSQLTANFNTGTSEIYGFEVDGSIEPIPGLVFDAAYAYLHTKITSIDAPPALPGFPYTISNPARVGDRLRQTPEHKFTVGGEYTFDLPEDMGKIAFGSNYTYVSNQLTNYIRRNAAGKLNGTSIIPSRQLFDAHIDWRQIAGSTVDLSLFGTNLGGTKYWTYVTDAANFGARQIGAPRMYGVRLRYSFGG